MLPLPAPAATPTAPPPAAPPVTKPSESDTMMDDDDDKSKVSRWQIGSSSLSVLEQVYQMEPFPGV